MKINLLRLPMLLVALLFLQGQCMAGHIDLFETAQSAETSMTTPPPHGVGSVANPTATALGGERDLFVNKTGGVDDERLRARVNPLGTTNLRIDSDSEVLGSVFVTWDGADGDPNPFSGIDYDGLGGIDLTEGGMWDGFDLTVSFSDIGGPVKLSIFDNAANDAASVATGTFMVPSGIPINTPTAIHIDFADFTGTTSALTNAGAVLMEVVNDSGALDMHIVSLVRTETIPEPSAFLLLGVAPLFGLLMRRRRS